MAIMRVKFHFVPIFAEQKTRTNQTTLKSSVSPTMASIQVPENVAFDCYALLKKQNALFSEMQA